MSTTAISIKKAVAPRPRSSTRGRPLSAESALIREALKRAVSEDQDLKVSPDSFKTEEERERYFKSMGMRIRGSGRQMERNGDLPKNSKIRARRTDEHTLRFWVEVPKEASASVAKTPTATPTATPTKGRRKRTSANSTV